MGKNSIYVLNAHTNRLPKSQLFSYTIKKRPLSPKCNLHGGREGGGGGVEEERARKFIAVRTVVVAG